MRTIKFRGKRIDGQGWAYGYYQPYKNDMAAFIGNYNGITDIPTVYKVLPESVGQWTGLVDRHGKEIYEGDILRNITNPLVDNEPFLVCYDTQEGMWMWFDKNEEGDSFNWAIAKHSEIIGNIIDSPELMEVE